MKYKITPPRRFAATQRWFIALYAWDHSDTTLLAELVKSEPIPSEYRTAIAAIITGHRKPNKASAKLKIPARDHLKIVRDLAADMSMREIEKEFAEETAAIRGLKAIEIIRYAENAYRTRVTEVARQYNVSTETIENIVRRMKSRFNTWPVV